jgi:hypothetical protein
VRIRKQEQGFEARLSSADIAARGALDVFEKAALDLEAAADAADAVVAEAEAEVVRLRSVRDLAYSQVAKHRAKADKIREFAK